MRKSDLKTGMLVEYRNGKIGKVLKDTGAEDVIAGRGTGFMPLLSYREDLTTINRSSADYDIMKVYKYSALGLVGSYDIERYILAYERNEVKGYTIKELEEIIGCKIRIVEGGESKCS